MAPRYRTTNGRDHEQEKLDGALRRRAYAKSVYCKALLSSSVWQGLPQELMEHTLTTLPLVDMVRSSGTCRAWHKAILSPVTLSILTWKSQQRLRPAPSAEGQVVPWFLCGYKPNKKEVALGRQCEWVAFDPNTDTWNWMSVPTAPDGVVAWRTIPPCTRPGTSKRRRASINMLGCAFDASLDGNLHLPLPSTPPDSNNNVGYVL
ncbi:hypothetical protein L7F22_055677 [Adiantum nelumboides]|nr:hypothetical protein [Adiantum nelumboides]